MKAMIRMIKNHQHLLLFLQNAKRDLEHKLIRQGMSSEKGSPISYLYYSFNLFTNFNSGVMPIHTMSRNA